MDTQEPYSCLKRNKIILFLQRFVSLDEKPNEKHHFPIFMIILCLLHAFIHLLLCLDLQWKDQRLEDILLDLFNFYVPCMRPTPASVRSLVRDCYPYVKNITCNYGDNLKTRCSSFIFPYQLWRLFSCNLLHQKTFHLISTLLKQILVGIPLERKYGSCRIFIIYWLSEFGASLYCSLKDADSPSVGASGALYGLLLFYTIDRVFALHNATINRRVIIFLQLTLLIILPIMKSILIPIIFKFRVVHSAHIGGALVGSLLGIAMIDCPWLANDRYHICQRIAFVLLTLYFLITIYSFFKMNAPYVSEYE